MAAKGGAEAALSRLAARLGAPPATPWAWDASLVADAQQGLACAGAAATTAAAQLLRRCGAALGDEAASPAAAVAFIAAASLAAAAALQAAGPGALGARARPRELALQRYALARRLVARGASAAALQHASSALRSLSTDAAESENTPPTQQSGDDAFELPPLRAPLAAGEAEADVTLAVGAALCCVGAAAEAGRPAPALAALRLAEQMPPWIRRAPPAKRAQTTQSPDDSACASLCAASRAPTPRRATPTRSFATSARRGGGDARRGRVRWAPAAPFAFGCRPLKRTSYS